MTTEFGRCVVREIHRGIDGVPIPAPIEKDEYALKMGFGPPSPPPCRERDSLRPQRRGHHVDLVNHTAYPAVLTRFAASDDVMGATLVVRVTYDIEDGVLTASRDQIWPVSPQPWECEYGAMEADDAFYKGGVDLFVFGSARAPQRRPVTLMPVTFEVGAFRRDLLVIGDRRWVGSGSSLAIGPAQPFVEMPLTLPHAYGGVAEWDGVAVPFADNAAGKGFFIEVDQAAGQPLPNLEDPRARIARWDDRPPPVGVGICPPSHGGRLRAGVTFADDGVLERLDGRLFNAAFPDMVVPQVRPGELIRLTGVSHDGPVEFRVPPVPVAFELRLGDTLLMRAPAIDQVGVEVDRRRVFLTFRYPFRYVLYQGQRRAAELVMAHAPRS